MPRRLLIVEDDPEIARLVRMHLEDAGYETEHCDDGGRALQLIRSRRPELAILDLMLPGMSGLELCRHIRELPSYLPVLMLTAKSTELDRVLGLELGADDYLTKPFSIPELVARVNALLRRVDAMRNEARSSQPRVRVDDLEIDAEKRTVRRNDRPLQLTSKEFDLLLEFASHPGRAYTREQLLNRVWGYGHDGYEHTVNSHINRLRAKIEPDPGNPRFILTVWGIGYKFAELRGCV